jgi:ribosomal protein S18 acetylase RimI-like enzyme
MIEILWWNILRCEYCGKNAVYRCGVCGHLVCQDHVKIRAVCGLHEAKFHAEFEVTQVSQETERMFIGRVVENFWGEREQSVFDMKFEVSGLPGFVAYVGKDCVGFISFTLLDASLVIVALAVLPLHQSGGIGEQLVRTVEAEARKQGRTEMLVSTSNDDLPALAFYQRLGFQIYGVKPDAIAEKHGAVLPGIGGLPVRDELRLRKRLN